MKILFIVPDFPEILSNESIFPFGYSSLDAILTKHGYAVEIIFPAAHCLNVKDVLEKIKKTDAEIVGIGGLFHHLQLVAKIVHETKRIRPDIKVVLGGLMVTHTPELAMKKTGADFSIVGEGEIALPKLLKCLTNSSDYSKIPGVVYRDGNRIIQNGHGEMMPFEDVPMPNWDKFPMEHYNSSGWYLPPWSSTKNKVVMSWLLSRGCPLKCNFCTSGMKPRYKSIKQSMGELREINDRFKPDYIIFYDNYLMRNKKFSKEFSKALIKEKFNFKYSMTGRFGSLDREQLKLLKKSGCEIVFYGIESANDDILNAMDKNINVEQIMEGIKLTKEAGIYAMTGIMFGQPGETLDQFANSVKMTLTTSDCNFAYPNVGCVMPLITYPGTPIYQYALDKGYIKDDNDYYNKYFSGERINYTEHSEDAIQQALDIANDLNKWHYYYTMANHLENKLAISKDVLVSKIKNRGNGETGLPLSEIKRIIRISLDEKPIPILIKEDRKGFNIVLFKGRYYCFSQSLGPLDLTETDEVEIEALKEQSKCAVGNSLEEAIELIDRLNSSE